MLVVTLAVQVVGHATAAPGSASVQFSVKLTTLSSCRCSNGSNWMGQSLGAF